MSFTYARCFVCRLGKVFRVSFNVTLNKDSISHAITAESSGAKTA